MKFPFEGPRFSAPPQINLRELARRLREAPEDGEAEKDAIRSEGGDSLDVQIDKYLSDYESEARTMKQEGVDFRSMTQRMLMEAEDEEEVETEPAETEEPAEMSLSDIDVGAFASDVARLIENADGLIEFRNTIARRAAKFLEKNYSSEVVAEFENVLSNEHGIEDGKSKEDLSAERYPAPAAARAGDGGAGGGGGL